MTADCPAESAALEGGGDVNPGAETLTFHVPSARFIE
jgi:hypothetical protein